MKPPTICMKWYCVDNHDLRCGSNVRISIHTKQKLHLLTCWISCLYLADFSAIVAATTILDCTPKEHFSYRLLEHSFIILHIHVLMEQPSRLDGGFKQKLQIRKNPSIENKWEMFWKFFPTVLTSLQIAETFFVHLILVPSERRSLWA